MLFSFADAKVATGVGVVANAVTVVGVSMGVGHSGLVSAACISVCRSSDAGSSMKV